MPTKPLEVDTPERLEALLASGRGLRGIRLQDLDLTAYAAALLRRRSLEGLVVLGGTVPADLATHLREHGALVFPSDPRAPVDVYRATLYQPDDLYAGLSEGGYPVTPDCRAYDWARDATVAGDVLVTLLRAIHDQSITDALDEALIGARVAGIMGGHAHERGTSPYVAAARLGQDLARAGLVVLTGGGPGAMEAANLGAFARSPAELAAALDRLADVPDFGSDVTAWAASGLEIRRALVQTATDGGPSRSFGIPTWFYGHEPPNVFCDGIAKYFSNALREDGLLARCNAGIVVMPGAAGTVQEIFQAVTPLHYADVDAALPPLVLVGGEHWTSTVPVWPAVQALAAGRPMASRVHLVDDPAEAAALLIRD